LAKVLKHQKKFKDLQIKDIFSISNKIIDLGDLDFVHTFQDEEEIDIKLFDLGTEQMLVDLNDNSDYESESQIDDSDSDYYAIYNLESIVKLSSRE
jgi:hypothetical protein